MKSPWLTRYATLSIGFCLALSIITLLRSRVLTAATVAAATAHRDTAAHIARLEAELADLQTRFTADTDLAKQLATSPDTDASIAATALTKKDENSRSEQADERARNDPAYAPYQRRKDRRNIQKSHGELFESLRLDPGMLDKFKGLLIERDKCIADAQHLALQQGFDANSQPELTAWSTAENDINREIRTLLGEERFRACEDFEALAPHRHDTDDFQNFLADRSLPRLSREQARLVTLAHYETLSSLSAEDHAPDFKPEAHSQPGDAGIRKKVSPVLTPEQRDAFLAYQHIKADERALTLKLTPPATVPK